MKLFELIYFMRDTTLIKILINNELSYAGDVYTYRAMHHERYALHLNVSSISAKLENYDPVIIINLEVK